jgi:hypothetical protein
MILQVPKRREELMTCKHPKNRMWKEKKNPKQIYNNEKSVQSFHTCNNKNAKKELNKVHNQKNKTFYKVVTIPDNDILAMQFRFDSTFLICPLHMAPLLLNSSLSNKKNCHKK